MNRVGLTGDRPRILLRHSSNVVELITQKTISQISDLNFVAHHFVLLDEGVDEFHHSDRSFFAFPQPLNYIHSTARTIRMSKESGVDDKVWVQIGKDAC